MKFRRWFSALIALLLLFTLFPSAALAVEEPEDGETYQICGFKYDDETGEGIADWTICLETLENDSWVPAGSTTTGADGLYCFDGLAAGDYRVSEADEPGWDQVYPGGDGMHYVTLPNRSMIYGIQRSTGAIYKVDPLSPTTPALYAQIDPTAVNKAFSGTSPNGIGYDQDTGDVYFATYPAPSVLYKIDTSGVQRNLGQLTGSVASGEFYNGKFYYIADGTDDLYVVTFQADGTIDTITPHMDISGGASAWFFGDVVVDHKEGVIYGEGQSGGKQEFFKVGLDGSGYSLIKVNGSTTLLQLAIGTDDTLYAHSAYNGDFYIVDRLTGTVTPIADGVSQYTDISSASVEYYNFRNCRSSETYDICGTKYDDTGTALGGFTIILEKQDGDTWDEIGRQVTDAGGGYCFTGLEAGTYRVSEEPEFGWTQILPTDSGAYTLTLPEDASDSSDPDAPVYDFVNRICYHDETAWAYGNNENWDYAGSNNWGWSNGPLEAGTYDYPLYAGAGQNDISKGTQVGTVHVVYDGTTVTVTYEPFDGIELLETHLWVGDQPLPYTVKKGVIVYSNAPGRMTSPAGEAIDVSGFDAVYVAAHAVARIPCDFDGPYSALCGDWRLSVNDGAYMHYMNISVDVNGNITGAGYYPFEMDDPLWCDWTIISGTVTGDSVTFGIDYIEGLRDGNFYFSGTLQEDGSIAGTWGTSPGSYTSGSFTATRIAP